MIRSTGGLFGRWLSKVRPRQLFDDNGDEIDEQAVIDGPEIEEMINLDNVTNERSVANTDALTNEGTPGTSSTGLTLGASVTSVTHDDNYASRSTK